MTYFGFLGYFIIIPLAILLALTYWDVRRGRQLPPSLRTWSPLLVVAAHVLIAVLYTTPWDNYLVATGVWWYDPNLVTGIVIGWVPIEEYTFFVLQTILTGSWLLFLARRSGDDGPVSSAGWTIAVQRPASNHLITQSPNHPITQSPGHLGTRSSAQSRALRYGSLLTVAAIWLASIVLLVLNWKPGTYLALELAWALLPIMFQLGFGADILWHYRRLVFWALLPSTVYLCLGDALAIGSGTWTIDPAQSTGILFGNLPLEEMVFFFVTNTLVVFGMILVLARASQQRVPTQVVEAIARLVSQKSLARVGPS